MRILLLIFLILVFCSQATASDFTVDSRSGLHFSVSAAISSTCTALTYGANSKAIRNQMCFWSTMAVGAVKEFGLDEHADYGDLAFNAAGAMFGIYLTDRIILHFTKDSLTLSGNW